MREVRNSQVNAEYGYIERMCSLCHELWPLTEEFFQRYKSGPKEGNWESWCKACYSEYQAARYAAKKKKEQSPGQ